MREVSLKIKVDDREVDQSAASLARLKLAAADLAGRNGTSVPHAQALTDPKYSAAFKEHVNNLRAVETATDAVTAASGGASTGFSALAIAGGVVAGAIAAVAAGILIVIGVGLTFTAWVTRATKAFADYAIEIGNVSEATGLAAQTVSALRHEAEAQGRSFGVVESAAASFRKTIGEADAGSKTALASLKALGLDGKTAIYDVDSAFKQAIATIVKTPDPVEQARLAFAAFGDDGAKLLPFLREFQGDVDKAIKKAEELGIVVSGDNVDAAREFNRAYEDVRKQVLAVTYAFGREFLPVVGDVMTRFSGWMEDNRGSVNRFASATRLMVEDAIAGFNRIKKWVDDNPRVVNAALLAVMGSPVGMLLGGVINHYGNAVNQQPLGGGLGGSALVPDDGALGAKFGFKPPKEKTVKDEMTEAEKQAKALREMISGLNREIEFFGDKSEVAATKQKIMAIGVRDLTTGLAAEAISLAAVLDKKNAEAEAFKKAEEARKRYAETLKNQREGVANNAFDERLSLTEQLTVLQKQADLGRELSEFEKSRVANMVQLTAVREAARRAGLNAQDLERLETQIQKEQELTDVIRERIQVLIDEAKERERIKALDKSFQGFTQNLEDQLDAVRRGNDPLTVYEETLRAIGRDYKDLDPAQKQHLLDLSDQIDAIKELNRQHAELKAFFKDGLRYAFEGNFQGLFESWGDRIKDTLADKLSDIFASNLLGFDPKKTNNPIARPIVDKLDQIHTTLKIGAGGGAAAAAGGGGGGGIIRSILGAIGIGPGGTAPFNGDGTQVWGGPTQTIENNASSSELFNTLNLRGGGTFTATGGGIFGQLRNLFSSKPGGLFAPRGGSGAAGYIGGIGDLATIAGGLIGGRAGGFIGSVGTGASIGATFGGLPGAIIGAIGGAILGLFGINGQRRRDERTRNQGMLDAQAAITKQFDALATQVRFGQIDPASAIIQGTNIGDQVRTQYLQMAGALTDKKTRRIALADVSRVDSLIAQKMAELRGLTDIAQGSADRNKRILPEFAGGHFFRPNGLLPGMFDGRDDILAKISRGEMVLNPAQQSRARLAAGFDVFASAGIPNYPRANPSSHLAQGGITGGFGLSAAAPNIVMQPRFQLVVEGATFDERTKAYLIGDDGNRTLVDVIKKKQKDNSIL